jgi:hypothetical protein
MKTLALIVVTLALSSNATLAASNNMAMRDQRINDCKADKARFCASGGGHNCLLSHKSQLSGACQAAVDHWCPNGKCE